MSDEWLRAVAEHIAADRSYKAARQHIQTLLRVAAQRSPRCQREVREALLRAAGCTREPLVLCAASPATTEDTAGGRMTESAGIVLPARGSVRDAPLGLDPQQIEQRWIDMVALLSTTKRRPSEAAGGAQRDAGMALELMLAGGAGLFVPLDVNRPRRETDNGPHLAPPAEVLTYADRVRARIG